MSKSRANAEAKARSRNPEESSSRDLVESLSDALLRRRSAKGDTGFVETVTESTEIFLVALMGDTVCLFAPSRRAGNFGSMVRELEREPKGSKDPRLSGAAPVEIWATRWGIFQVFDRSNYRSKVISLSFCEHSKVN